MGKLINPEIHKVKPDYFVFTLRRYKMPVAQVAIRPNFNTAQMTAIIGVSIWNRNDPYNRKDGKTLAINRMIDEPITVDIESTDKNSIIETIMDYLSTGPTVIPRVNAAAKAYLADKIHETEFAFYKRRASKLDRVSAVLKLEKQKVASLEEHIKMLEDNRPGEIV